MQEDVYQGDGLNLYAYCRNNPVVYYDPSGYSCKNSGNIAGDGSENKVKITSNIKKDPRLIKAAEEMGKNQRIQQEANHLISELLKGSENPGIESKNLFKGISYLRGRNGARIFFRKNNNGYEIIGKADKSNEQIVINIIKKLYK